MISATIRPQQILNLVSELRNSFEERVTQIVQPVFEGSKPVLLNNFFSAAWRFSHPLKHPYQMPLFYFCGVVSFTLALPVRIALVAATAFYSVCLIAKALFHRQLHTVGKNVWPGGLLFAASLGELGSCMIGIVCPPIAYRIDEFIQSHPVINCWYAKYGFTVWSHKNGQIVSVGDENPLELDSLRSEHTMEYFIRGGHQIKKFISEDEQAMPATLNKIAAAGLLHMLMARIQFRRLTPKEEESWDSIHDIFSCIWRVHRSGSAACVDFRQNEHENSQLRHSLFDFGIACMRGIVGDDVYDYIKPMSDIEFANYVLYAIALSTRDLSDHQIEEHFKEGEETVKLLKENLDRLKLDEELYDLVQKMAEDFLLLVNSYFSRNRKQFRNMAVEVTK